MLKPFITRDNVRDFACIGDSLLTGKPRGILLDFHGLNGGTQLLNGLGSASIRTQQYGAVYVHPYYGPWSWMNDVAVATVDAIVDALFELYGLPANTPIVSSGGSMGGLSALIYTRYAKRTPAACVVNCPVCDLVYHFTERPDLPRTIWSALAHYEGTFEAAKESISPLHQAEKMPNVPYTFFHNTADLAVNKEMHSDRMVQALRDSGHDVTYIIGDGYGHTDLPPALHLQYEEACNAPWAK